MWKMMVLQFSYPICWIFPKEANFLISQSWGFSPVLGSTAATVQPTGLSRIGGCRKHRIDLPPGFSIIVYFESICKQKASHRCPRECQDIQSKVSQIRWRAIKLCFLTCERFVHFTPMHRRMCWYFLVIFIVLCMHINIAKTMESPKEI